jgi:predicted PurR-regulated permease PerM
VAFFLGVIVAVVLRVGLWFFYNNMSRQGFSRVYSVLAYVDADGGLSSVCLRRWVA